jgi:hypothetical protein
MINTIHPYNPDRCPRDAKGDAKADLNFRTDRDTFSKRPEAYYGRRRNL